VPRFTYDFYRSRFRNLENLENLYVQVLIVALNTSAPVLVVRHAVPRSVPCRTLVI
jgi:hypothetical protein